MSIDLDHLRIRAVILEISLPLEGVASYKPVLLWHRASVSEVTLLRPHDLVSHTEADTQKMAVGVIDYSWTGSPDEGRLHQGDRYFCFLLYKSSSGEGWQKVLTERVAFLVNGQELVQELELLCIYTRQGTFL